MPKDDEDFVGRDNLFHRRVSDVRNKVGLNINESEALDLIQNPGKAQYFFQPQIQYEDLNEEEIDRRRSSTKIRQLTISRLQCCVHCGES